MAMVNENLKLSPWRDVVIMLICVIPLNFSSHERCWNCSSQCRRCIRDSVPVEKIVAEFYSGLFSNVAPHENKIHDLHQRSISGKRKLPSAMGPPSAYGCCETDMVYERLNTTTIGGVEYKVVQLREMFQFIPIGVCRPGPTCVSGECVQRYRTHWVLVHDATIQTEHPPIRFLSLRVKSHCECMNVGRAGRK